MSYIIAKGEADELCAALAKAKRVDAVLSEDTDMFAYGVPVILKYFSFVKHTVVQYDTTELLDELNLDYEEFLEVCVLSGTDYNKSCGSLFNIYNHMMEYKKNVNDVKNVNNSIDTFGTWVSGNHLENMYYDYDVNEIMNSKKYYKINARDILKQYPFIVIKSGG